MNDINKTISFGKVDGYGNDRKSCEVTIDITMRDGRLSFSGNVWDTSHTDIIHCGQCYDTLLELLPHNKKLREIVDVWKRWHMNDIRPECEHQRELGWREQASEPLYVWKLSLNIETYTERKRIEETVMQQVRSTRQASISEEEAAILAMPLSFLVYTQDKTTPTLPDHYGLNPLGPGSNPTEKTRRWITEAEDPAGILSKPCPICGYKYGSEWKFEAIPNSVIDQIRTW